MDKKAIEYELKKKHYGLYGSSAVQICEWNRKVLRNKEPCYKQVFYGVHTHRCMQFSPSATFCTNECIFCWRPAEYMGIDDAKAEVFPKPKELVKALIEERKKLLSGFGGREGINKELFQEALKPDHFAISLSGEPLIYPYMPQLIKHLKNDLKSRSIFIVSNGTLPKMLKEMIEKDSLPDQFYVSMVAGDEKSYNIIVKPRQKDAWKKYLEFLKLFSTLRCRKVIRFTLITGMNEKNIKQYADLMKMADPDFIEIKAYMHLGYSRERLKMENMPLHKEVIEFSNKLLKELDSFEMIDQHPVSRIVLLKNKNSKVKKDLF